MSNSNNKSSLSALERIKAKANGTYNPNNSANNSSQSALDRIKAKANGTYDGGIDIDAFKSWFTNTESTIKGLGDYYTANEGKWVSDYGADFTDSIADLKNNAKNVEYYLRSHKDEFSDYDTLSKAFSEYSKYLEEAEKQNTSLRDFYSQFGSEEEYETWNMATKAEEEYKKLFENIDTGKASQGLQKYLADEEAKKNAPKYDLNNDGKDAWWEKALGYLGGGGGVVDTTMPTAGVTQTVNALREDESHRRPNDSWTEEQKNAFGQLYLESPEKAFAFAELTNKRNNREQEEAQIQGIKDSATSSFGAGLGHTLGAIATAPLGLADYLGDLAYANAGRDIAPDGSVSPFEYSQAVTGGISEHLNEKGGVINENNPVFGGKGWGDVYGLGVSIAQSMSSGYILGPAGTLVSYFGQGAASGVDEALARGASEGQAFVYGAALGAFEGIAEQIGIDNLFKLGSASSLKGLLKNVLKQAGAEGAEEGLTAILSNIADNVIMQDKSNFNLLVAEYMAQGMSEEEAKKKAWASTVGDIAFDTIAGAVSGAVSGGLHTGVPSTINAVAAKKNYSGQAQDIVNEAVASEDADVKAVGEKYQQKLTDGKKLSGWNLSELLEVTDNSKVKSAVEAQLTKLGETGDVTAIADVITKQVQGVELSNKEQALIDGSKYGQRIVNTLDRKNIKSGEYDTRWAKEIGTRRLNADVYNKSLYDLAADAKDSERKASLELKEMDAVAESTPVKENAVGGEISAPTGKVNQPVAKATMVDNEGNTVEAKVAKIVSVEGKEAMLELEGGQTVKASDVELKDSGIGFVYNAATEMVSGVGGFNVDAANVMVRGFNSNGSLQAAGLYVSGFNEAYRYGAMGYPVSALATGNATSKLSAAQRETAYNLGKAYGEGKVAEKQAKIDSTVSINDGKDSQKANKKGKVYFDGSAVGKSLTERQKASLKGLRLVAEATGVDIHIFESMVGNNGKRQGANGWYDPVKKEIHLDLHAGIDGNGLMLFTASHELTHHIREVAPAKFKAFADALLEEYTKSGQSIDELISRKLETLEANGRLEGVTKEQAYDLAYEEVVADAAESMLVDSNAIEALSKKLQAKDKSLWETIKDFIAKLVNRIRAAYEGIDPDSNEGKLVREMKDSAERLQKLWVDALLEASEVGTSVDLEAQTDKSAKYMDRKVDNKTKKRYNKRLIRDEFATNAMIWAFSGKTKPGDVKVLYNPRDNTWNKLVADNTEERYGILLSVEDTPQNAEAIRNLYNEVYNEDNGEQQGIDESIREDYERYWSLSDNSGDDNFDVGKQSADGHARELYGSKPQSNRDSDFRQGPRDSEKVKYSDRNKADAEYLDAVNRGDMATAQKMVDEAAKKAGYTVKAYHGTSRGDRVGNVFLPERATSGPMAFFTDNRVIAEGYSKGKQDTSMAYDPDFDQYETQFRIKTKYNDMPLYKAWGYLPFDARNRITKKAGQLREDWDGDGELILDPTTNEAGGGFQWQLKEARGNAIQALTEQWLNSGNLFNEEGRFLDVLEMAGVTEEFKKIGMDSLYFKDPHARHEKVYDTFLKINNPLDTSLVDEKFVTELEAWYEEQDQSKYQRESVSADLWDKNSIDAYDFAERVRDDIERGTFHAWTSIPDSVTDYLKHMGYDGIKDVGGKNGGEGHTVWIPFSSEQVKSAEPVSYNDKGEVIPLSERFNPKNNDIRYSDRYGYREGLNEDDREVADAVVHDLRQRALASKYGISPLGTYTADRIDYEISYSSAEFAPDYANSYITWVKPTDFVYATTASQEWRNKLTEEAGELDVERLTKQRQPIYLRVDFKTGEIVGHEGRHRMLALQKAGVERVAVIIESRNDDIENTKPIETMYLKGQEFGEYKQGMSFFLHNMLPLSQRYASVAKEVFSHDSKGGVRFSDRASYAPTFYSHMGKVVDDIKLEKMGTSSILNHLKNRGVKDEEIKWSGIETFLEGKKSVTKAELQEFVAGSQLQIVEQMSDDEEYTHWSQYKLGGGSNYRELVFQLPDSTYSNNAMRGHWGQDAEGVLAHARIQDFIVDGKKMLFVEEIQSDWHNAGQKYGYEDKNVEWSIRHETRSSSILGEDRYVRLYKNGKPTDTFYPAESFEIEDDDGNVIGLKSDKEILAEIKKNRMADEAPDAPFRTTYHEYVLKRLLRMAAEEGYDSIGWTTADIQSQRWSDEYAEGYRIEYDQDIPKFLRKYGKKWGATVGKTVFEEMFGGTVYTDKSSGMQYSAEELPLKAREIVAKRLGLSVEDTDPNVEVSITGAVYVDAKNDTHIAMEVEQSHGTIVWSMPIPGSMKESVLYEGQALYQDRNPDSYSNRSLLAGALETAVQNDIEREKLRQYKQKIDLINSEEQKLHDLREQIKELSFAKGPRDTEAIRSLQFEANQAANRINTYDRQLLNLESTKALKGVLEREKALARKRDAQKYKEALERYREKSAKTQRELMDRYQESLKRGVESRNKTAMRHKIKGIVKELDTLLRNPTAKKHIKEELRREVADALLAINMDTVDADARVAKYNALIARESDPDIIAELTKTRDNIQLQGDSLKEKLTTLQNAYEKIKTTEDIELSMSYQEVIRNSIKNVSDKVGNTSIRNMTLEQLEMVYDLFKMIRHTIRDANKAFNEQKGQTIMQMAEAVNDQVRTVGGQPYKRNAVFAALQRAGWTFLKPLVAFRTIGSITLTNLYKELRVGEDTFYNDVSEAQAFIEAQYKKHNYKAWDMKKTKSFTAKSGKAFDLTLEQMMTLYAYSRRDQAHKHIIEGGVVFEDAMIVEKNKWGVPIKYEVTTKDAFNLSEETFAEIANSLTKEQKEFVDTMQNYLSNTMGAKGNEVSMKLLGVKLFKEEFYLPIKSSQYYRNFSAEEAGEVKLKSPAFSKETVKHANNPIVLHNFTDLWAEHINDMSMYHSFVLALEDFTRVYNYKTKTDAKVETMDTKATLETAYPGVTKYISKFLKDMNGGVRSETVGWAEKLTSLSKKGAVLGSASVAIQQPSAVMRAMAMINPKYFVTTAHQSFNLAKHKQDWAELKKYAPVAGIKEMGRFDVGMGQGTVDWIQSNKTLMEKGEDVLSAAPAFMDEVTWVTIWNAVKREAVHNNPKLKTSSEEFLKLAGERFTDVISMTQVYDSVFSRSDLMRNKSWIAKSLTAYMAEPSTTLNMIWDSWVQAKREGGAKAYAKSTITTGGPIIASIVLNAALKAIVMAMRDDDEDESYKEKYLEHFFGDLKDNLNPLTLVPLAKDIVSIFKGYDVERMDMALFSDFKNAIDAFDNDNKTLYEKWSGLIGATSAFFGIPVKNVERDVRALITTVFGKTEDTTAMGILNAIEEGWTGKEKSNGQQLYDAMVKGDSAQIERIKGRFEDQTAINSAIRKALRENDPRIKEAAEARYNGDIAEYMKIAKEIIAEGHFKQDDIVAAINSEINELKPDTPSTPSNKAVSLYSIGDYYSAIMGGESAAAYAVKEDLIETDIANGKDRDEAEASFNSKLTSHVREQYEAGEINDYKAQEMLTYYAGKTEEEADSKVQYWNFKKEYPDYDLSESAVSKYYSDVQPSGISVAVYYDYSKQRTKAQGVDLNGDGKTDSGSVKAEVMQIINSLPISSYQKDALYYLNGWSQSTLWEAPWH